MKRFSRQEIVDAVHSMKLSGPSAPSEPHKIAVQLWHNAKLYDVVWNQFTAPVLRQLYFDTQGRYYMNPTESEWAVLSQYTIQ